MKKRNILLIGVTVILVLMLSLVSCRSTTSYSISFSGTDAAVQSVSVNAGEVPEIPAVPEKVGYIGVWTLDGNAFDASQKFELGKNIELVASYTPISYNVVFKADGAQVGKTQTYTVENKNITAPEVPEKAGYTGEWEAYTLTTGDITVKAVYTPVTYKVIFMADGVQVGDALTYTVENKNITEPAVPAKEGYTGKWEEYTLTTGDVTVNAVYSVTAYSVVFMADGVQVGEAQSYTAENKSIDEPAVPVKAGYTGVWEAYTLTTGDVTVNAIYTANNDTKYTVEHYVEKLDGSYELYSSEEKQGTTDSTASADALAINHYVASEASVSGNIAGDGSLVLKLYYNLELVDVTFVYGGAQENGTVQVKYGATVSADSASQSSKYPFALVEWQKDGAKFDFDTEITEALTLTAVYENQLVYADFEGEQSWMTTTSATYSVTSTAIAGNYSGQFVTTGTYNGIYRWNLTDSVDFSDINYIYLKVKVNTNARITVRFFKQNNLQTEYMQAGFDVKADGAWHLLCVDVNSLSGFDKEEIKAMLIMSDVANTVTVDDITFVNDKAKYDDSIVSCYDFNTEGGWNGSSSTGVKLEYTDGAIKFNTTAWHGIYNQRIQGNVFADVNYIYLKVKADDAATVSIRFYTNLGIGTSYVGAGGALVESDGEYHIIRFDVSDWNALASNSSISNASFDKSAIQTMLIRSSTATTITIDEVIFSTRELDITYNITFVADGATISEQTYTMLDKNIVVPEIPAKEGYTAVWASYTLGFGDVVVKAVYTPIKYTVTFVANGATVAEKTYTVENAVVEAPAVPELAGYAGAWEAYTLTGGNVTVNAVYTVVTYKVVFMADGAVVEELTYTVENNSISEPQLPIKNGYISSWEDYTLTTGDVIVEAVFTPIVYTVTFVADGVIVAEVNYTVENKNIVEPDVPAKTRYTGAWELYTLNVGNITVNAIYTEATEYKVIFKADGVTVSEQTFTADDKNITVPEVPTKAGYSGIWETYTLGEADVTVNAIYTANNDTKYTVEYYVEKLDGSYELYSSEEKQGTTDTTATAEAIAINHYVASEASVSGNIAGDGSLVLKLYYNLELVDVTFVYGGAQENGTVQVKYGATVSADSASQSSKYPFALVEWQKDGAKFDFATAITADTTLIAVYENEYVYENFETGANWNTTTKATYNIANTISGSKSLKIVAASAYNGVYRNNLTDKIDLTDVNYIYFKVRTDTAAKITFRFFTGNDANGSTYMQSGVEVAVADYWQTVCIDISNLTTFSKSDIRTMLIMINKAATVEIDDIVFAREETAEGVTFGYDFAVEGGWYASDKVNGGYVAPSYVTDEDGNQCIQVTATAWNGVFTQNLASTEIANANYIYVKVKSSKDATLSMRIFSGLGIGSNYASVSGTAVKADGEYHIVKFDISNWDALTKTGTPFDKSGSKTMLIRTSAAATLTIDDVIFSTCELEDYN